MTEQRLRKQPQREPKREHEERTTAEDWRQPLLLSGRHLAASIVLAQL